MKVLFLSNFFPPHSIGGMELSCQETFDGLVQRGHDCRVLTSAHGVRRPVDEGPVMRRLRLQMDLVPMRNAWSFLTDRVRLHRNQEVLREVLSSFAPDVVYVWGMWNLDLELAIQAERLMKTRVLYRFADYWPVLPSQYSVYWRRRGKGRIASIVKGILAHLALAGQGARLHERPAMQHGYCVSRGVRRGLVEHGISVAHLPIIYSGFLLDPFLHAAHSSDPQVREDVLRLLFVGRLVPDKGVETVLRAMAELATQRPDVELVFTIAGSGEPDYVRMLKQEAEQLGVDHFVRFVGAIDHGEVPKLMGTAEIVVVPSVWEEPLPRVAIEAMAAGCLVVGSRVGGTKEILEDGATGCLFPPGDHVSLAMILEKVVDGELDFRPMIEKARQSVIRRFRRSTMLDKVEELLRDVSHIRAPDLPTTQTWPKSSVSQWRRLR